MKLKSRFLVVALMLLIFSYSICSAETAQGRTIRLENYSGEVKVLTGAEKTVNLINKMRVFDGYTIITGKDASVYLSIDNTKAIRLDQNTKVSIVKKDKVNEIQVITGSIFFSVKEKLKTDETLDVVTPTMAIGIRGTTGTVSVIKEESRAQIYSGRVVAKNKRGKEKFIDPGHEVRESENKAKELEILKLDVSGQEIPSFSLNEINNDVEIKEQIAEEKVFELENFVEAEKVNKEIEKEELKQELEIIEEKKQEAQTQKAENVIESTSEIPTVVEHEFVGEKKALEKEFDAMQSGDSLELENSEGNLYIFEINNETGTAELKETHKYSGDLKIENVDNGSFKVYEDEKETIDFGEQGYEGAYKIVD